MELSVGSVPVRLTGATLLVMVLCVGAIGYAGYDYTQQSAAIEEAVAVNATVTETDIEETGTRGVRYEVTVVFTYEYEGTAYESNRLYPTTLSPTFETESKAQSVLASHEQNEATTAYVEPSDPDGAFLEPRRTSGPLWLAGGGGLVLLLTVLNAAGAQTPGQETGVAPADEREVASGTLFGVDRDRINWLSKRVIAGGAVMFVLTLVATVLLLAAAEDAHVEATVTDPAGLAVVTAFVSFLSVIGGLLLYGSWSFTEYRRLRESIPEPRPPSPFTHPTRLVTILRTDSDKLDDYGKRVGRTGFAIAVALFCLGVVLRALI
ncbi:DUF3592 domain-containing protein [Halovenus halobia]|uniref:DUF3592 domain-containing protein n=1 Tax=Halovenus halobia TaxID=3396622 RepID=UPI003F543A39